MKDVTRYAVFVWTFCVTFAYNAKRRGQQVPVLGGDMSSTSLGVGSHHSMTDGNMVDMVPQSAETNVNNKDSGQLGIKQTMIQAFSTKTDSTNTSPHGSKSSGNMDMTGWIVHGEASFNHNSMVNAKIPDFSGKTNNDKKEMSSTKPNFPHNEDIKTHLSNGIFETSGSMMQSQKHGTSANMKTMHETQTRQSESAWKRGSAELNGEGIGAMTGWNSGSIITAGTHLPSGNIIGTNTFGHSDQVTAASPPHQRTDTSGGPQTLSMGWEIQNFNTVPISGRGNSGSHSTTHEQYIPAHMGTSISGGFVNKVGVMLPPGSQPKFPGQETTWNAAGMADRSIQHHMNIGSQNKNTGWGHHSHTGSSRTMNGRVDDQSIMWKIGESKNTGDQHPVTALVDNVANGLVSTQTNGHMQIKKKEGNGQSSINGWSTAGGGNSGINGIDVIGKSVNTESHVKHDDTGKSITDIRLNGNIPLSDMTGQGINDRSSMETSKMMNVMEMKHGNNQGMMTRGQGINEGSSPIMNENGHRQNQEMAFTRHAMKKGIVMENGNGYTSNQDMMTGKVMNEGGSHVMNVMQTGHGNNQNMMTTDQEMNQGGSHAMDVMQTRHGNNQAMMTGQVMNEGGSHMMNVMQTGHGNNQNMMTTGQGMNQGGSHAMDVMQTRHGNNQAMMTGQVMNEGGSHMMNVMQTGHGNNQNMMTTDQGMNHGGSRAMDVMQTRHGNNQGMDMTGQGINEGGSHVMNVMETSHGNNQGMMMTGQGMNKGGSHMMNDIQASHGYNQAMIMKQRMNEGGGHVMNIMETGNGNSHGMMMTGQGKKEGGRHMMNVMETGHGNNQGMMMTGQGMKEGGSHMMNVMETSHGNNQGMMMTGQGMKEGGSHMMNGIETSHGNNQGMMMTGQGMKEGGSHMMNVMETGHGNNQGRMMTGQGMKEGGSHMMNVMETSHGNNQGMMMTGQGMKEGGSHMMNGIETSHGNNQGMMMTGQGMKEGGRHMMNVMETGHGNNQGMMMTGQGMKEGGSHMMNVMETGHGNNQGMMMTGQGMKEGGSHMMNGMDTSHGHNQGIMMTGQGIKQIGSHVMNRMESGHGYNQGMMLTGQGMEEGGRHMMNVMETSHGNTQGMMMTGQGMKDGGSRMMDVMGTGNPENQGMMMMGQGMKEGGSNMMNGMDTGHRGHHGIIVSDTGSVGQMSVMDSIGTVNGNVWDVTSTGGNVQMLDTKSRQGANNQGGAESTTMIGGNVAGSVSNNINSNMLNMNNGANYDMLMRNTKTPMTGESRTTSNDKTLAGVMQDNIKTPMNDAANTNNAGISGGEVGSWTLRGIKNDNNNEVMVPDVRGMHGMGDMAIGKTSSMDTTNSGVMEGGGNIGMIMMADSVNGKMLPNHLTGWESTRTGTEVDKMQQDVAGHGTNGQTGRVTMTTETKMTGNTGNGMGNIHAMEQTGIGGNIHGNNALLGWGPNVPWTRNSYSSKMVAAMMGFGGQTATNQAGKHEFRRNRQKSKKGGRSY